MSTFPIGLLAVFAVVFFSANTSDWKLYINTHAILLVLGGTVAILIMSTPRTTLRALLRLVLDVFKPEPTMKPASREILELSRSRRLSRPSQNPLISYATELWDQGVEPELFIVLLSQRRDEVERGHVEAIQAVRNLAKYPPALGMTGTVMGLVSLFSVLGGNAKSTLGPALALAMTATFFGLILANCAITPLADYLHIQHMQNERDMTSTYQLLILINRDEPMALVDAEAKIRGAA